MPDNQPDSIYTDELTLFQANSCPAELLIPYNLSANQSKFIPFIFYKSKFKQSILNMDSPLVMAMSTVVLLNLMATFILGIMAALGIAPLGAPAAVLALMPLSLFLLTVPLYATIVICNFKIGGNRNWKDKLLGPTHIGLTDSGFKLWWQGLAFYNYPNLALWTDIFYIDLKENERYGDQSLNFIYQSGFGRRTIELPLRGLINVEDARLVLDYFARNVVLDYQSDKFKEQAAIGFSDSLKEVDRQVLLNNEPQQGE